MLVIHAFAHRTTGAGVRQATPEAPVLTSCSLLSGHQPPMAATLLSFNFPPPVRKSDVRRTRGRSLHTTLAALMLCKEPPFNLCIYIFCICFCICGRCCKRVQHCRRLRDKGRVCQRPGFHPSVSPRFAQLIWMLDAAWYGHIRVRTALKHSGVVLIRAR